MGKMNGLQVNCVTKSSALRDDEKIFKPEKDSYYDNDADQKEIGKATMRSTVHLLACYLRWSMEMALSVLEGYLWLSTGNILSARLSYHNFYCLPFFPLGLV